MQFTRQAPPADQSSPLAILGRAGPRAVLGTFAVLLTLAAIAWYLTVQQAIGMAGMSRPGEMAAPLFMGMWLTMMVAMMFPTIGPMVLAHRGIVQRQGGRQFATIGFVLGYLAVWSLIGLVPLAAFVVLRDLPMDVRGSWFPTIAGIVLLAAGTYQFTAWKQLCLKTCRSPFTFLLSQQLMAGRRPSLSGDVRLGVLHGAYCLGCCWALMAVLLVVGLMNLAWMAAISAVFLVEKNLWSGLWVSRATGALTAGLGAVVLIHPALYSSISSPLFGMPM